jgi:hypothetical protein
MIDSNIEVETLNGGDLLFILCLSVGNLLAIGHLTTVYDSSKSGLNLSLVSIWQPFTKLSYQFIYYFRHKEKELRQDCKIQNSKK